jgi:hypothetical protein
VKYRHYICTGYEPDVTPLVIPHPECPNAADHTPAPIGYLAWHEWAEERSRTHDQEECPGCGFWCIDHPKVAT